jgi:hypothetical protein
MDLWIYGILSYPDEAPIFLGILIGIFGILFLISIVLYSLVLFMPGFLVKKNISTGDALSAQEAEYIRSFSKKNMNGFIPSLIVIIFAIITIFIFTLKEASQNGNILIWLLFSALVSIFLALIPISLYRDGHYYSKIKAGVTKKQIASGILCFANSTPDLSVVEAQLSKPRILNSFAVGGKNFSDVTSGTNYREKLLRYEGKEVTAEFVKSIPLKITYDGNTIFSAI